MSSISKATLQWEYVAESGLRVLVEPEGSPNQWNMYVGPRSDVLVAVLSVPAQREDGTVDVTLLQMAAAQALNGVGRLMLDAAAAVVLQEKTHA
jgi:hypothetical protein